jgi:isochorismate synthase EntC
VLDTGSLADVLHGALRAPRARHAPLARAALLELIARATTTGERLCAVIDERRAFVAIGVAAAVSVDDLPNVVTAGGAPLAVTLPFAVVSERSPWAALCATTFAVPKLWLYQRDGVLVVGAVHGADDVVSRVIEALRTSPARAPSPHVAADDGDVTPSPAAHAALVEAVATGAAKVVLARRRRCCATGLTAAHLVRALPADPSATTWLVQSGDTFVVGATPERLVHRAGREVEVDVLAGTAAAVDGDPAGADERLLSDDKELREHRAVLDFVAGVLSTRQAALVASPTRVKSAGRARHLHTLVRATLPDAGAPLLTPALHPTPAVLGAPRDVARAFLAEHELLDRGLYCGAIGFVERDERGAISEDVVVGLRCVHVHGPVSDQRVDLYAGGGIVRGSVAAREWRELDLKEHTARAAVFRAAREARDAH